MSKLINLKDLPGQKGQYPENPGTSSECYTASSRPWGSSFYLGLSGLG